VFDVFAVFGVFDVFDMFGAFSNKHKKLLRNSHTPDLHTASIPSISNESRKQFL
jgi:hypothetical protein